MNRLFVRLARAGAVLALVVVMLGAWVRLTDAGLGCPDWPGCYGRLVVPHPATSAEELGSEYTRPLEAGKAWREMIHRYLASTLGLICLALAVIALRNRRDPAQPKRAPAALVALVVFQGLLGMWTVTLLLKPIVVVAHLLGGFATLALLASLGRWRSSRIRLADARPACARPRRGRGARAPDLPGRLDERELCRARVPGFSRSARRNGGPRSRTSRKGSCCGAASASTTKAACSIILRAWPSISPTAWARSRPRC